MNLHELDDFTLAYLECALWSSTDNSRDDGGDPLDDNYGAEDMAPECLAQAVEDCRAFQADYGSHFEGLDAQAGHDFWLTRNRHGAGFWDRPDLYGQESARLLTEASHAYGSVDLYVGDDGAIYC